MRIFQSFPDKELKVKCPICHKGDDKPYVLIAIDGTQEGHNVQAQPFHLDCIELTWYSKHGLIAQKIGG